MCLSEAPLDIGAIPSNLRRTKLFHWTSEAGQAQHNDMAVLREILPDCTEATALVVI